MESTSMRWRGELAAGARRIEWAAVATWLLGFTLVAYLGVEGGGYDPLVHDQVGIAVWWILLAGLAVGVLPRRPLPPVALAALALLAAFVAWTALSLSWTESGERTFAELARVAGYLGVFALALFARGRDGARTMIGAVAAGVVVVAVVGLLSRLHPDWFPTAGQTASFLSNNSERLSYPLDYWNGLAALVAIGAPLLLQLAADARTTVVRAAAAAALPALALTAFFTLSRGGIAAAVLVLIVYLALAPDRVPRALTAALTATGSVVLILAASRRDSLQDGLLNSAARDQGDSLLVIVVLVCLAVGLGQAAISAALRNGWRPDWTHVSPRDASRATLVGLAVAVVALLAIDAPGRASDAWEEFKKPEDPGQGAGRLGSAAGQSRYQYWSATVDQNATDPLLGTGSGTFEYWWSRNGDNDDTVRDAHSLYMQTLGELGIVGLALLVAFLVVVLAGGARLALRAADDARGPLAAATAACLAFFLTASVDWMWQLPVLPVAMLLLAAALVGEPAVGADRPRPTGLALVPRLACALVALAAIVAIAIPLASTALVRQSEAEVREGDLSAALETARSAQNAEPSAAAPRLQQALVLEQLGDLDAAAEAAQGAAERESTNWRPWLVLSRIEARRGKAATAVTAYRRARSLNPNSPLFER
jgi:O-antigen ligase